MLQSKIRAFGGGVLLLIVIAGAWTIHSQRFSKAPDVTFKYIDGRQVELKHLESHPVLVTFWATSCPGCMKEMPRLITLYKTMSAQGLEIVGVAMAYDPPDRVLAMTSLRKIPYPIALDMDGSIARAFDNVTLTPTSFLIAPDGRIIAHIVGELDMEKLRGQISAMRIRPQVTSHESQEPLDKQG
jgi:peroxiredoxin